MSQETAQWLNVNTLIGFTDKRGTAWHYREELQGDESNHYPGAIPLDDVLRRLFAFEVNSSPLYIPSGDGFVEVPGRQAMVTSDSGEVLGIFKEGYQGHSYKEWLIDNVATILDDSLSIGSAGLLRNRAQAWVSVEVPENVTTPEGVEFRPNLLACTSYDGSLATTFGRKFTVTVCDNTLSAALSEQGQSFKVKHTRYSGYKLTSAREALAIVHTMAEDFSAEIASLCKQKVSNAAWNRMLDLVIPVPDEPGRAMTMAEKKRGEIVNLYNNDDRAASWNGTAFGVLQAFNTWNHHYAQVRKGVPRIVRNMENVVTDKMATADANIMQSLALALAK